MPELSTEHVTRHTVTFTDTELESLREAARIALSATEGTCVFTADWQALARLGKGATRDIVDTYANPALIGPATRTG
ncbi:hypothetical protein HRW07_10145 [Streptomyces lunaelactis]|uniref:hypothetical protein n=1 Tax=Streptomyces lunaelactis TaxID=1535768 RepID=UPI001585B628|nr:hypothetical protein [Streptomyces lunaelactis]NUL03589.1 hypothetical protein [Streptomyces lunaelactis]